MRTYALAGKRVWVVGHEGMVGAALARRLRARGCEVVGAARAQLDLRRQAEVERFVVRARPQAVIVAAGTVGGLHANTARPADFLEDNLLIAANVIAAAHHGRVEKLLYLGSSCMYPRLAAQPMREDALMTGAFEPTNAAYAAAKVAGMMLAQSYRRQHGDDFISALPTNLYGPGDTYDPAAAHVPAALIRRMHEARIAGQPGVEVWGSGAARREFLHVADLARACLILMERWSDEAPVNVGGGAEVSIAQLAQAIARVTGFRGVLRFEPSRPEGAPRKLLEGSRMAALGWSAQIGLEDGLRDAYADFLHRHARPDALSLGRLAA